MKLIIAGSRDIFWQEKIFSFIDETIKNNNLLITEVVSGKAPGVDSLGEQWAALHSLPVAPFPADWGVYPNIDKIQF